MACAFALSLSADAAKAELAEHNAAERSVKVERRKRAITRAQR
jgi:hypothetical protein